MVRILPAERAIFQTTLGVSAVPGEGPDRWPGELRGMQERWFGGEVKEIPEGCGCRIAAGQGCQPPFLLDRGQDRRVVVDH